MEESDAVLVQKVLSGQREAFAPLVERYQGMVFRLAYGLTGDRTEAEDLTQEVFLAFRSLGSYRGEAAFKTWLYQIAARTAIDWHRRRRNHGPLPESDMLSDSLAEGVAAHAASTSPQPEEAYLQAE